MPSISCREATSPCPEKRCVHSGAVQRRGGLIVCVSNRMVVRIESGSNPLDMVTE
ncbi:MAG TPA: NusG domain II-containing protein [bacterium]|nr:NusG domain II-containing protein [bacterium]HQI47999.1 NusG domain II-containing protein [bacterium]HQJ64969.1 NusG domain II-containing protein [bacterium]